MQALADGEPAPWNVSSHRTLVLNASYEPIHVVGWQRAVKMLFLNKVEAVANYDREILGGASGLPLPAVVRLNRRIKPHKTRVRFSRVNVFARDRWTCQYCGERHPASALTYDHVTPRVMGGKTSWTNIVACCIPCNRHKGGRTPEDAGMRLIRPPQRPDWLPTLGRNLVIEEPPAPWRPFLWHL